MRAVFDLAHSSRVPLHHTSAIHWETSRSLARSLASPISTRPALRSRLPSHVMTPVLPDEESHRLLLGGGVPSMPVTAPRPPHSADDSVSLLHAADDHELSPFSTAASSPPRDLRQWPSVRSRFSCEVCLLSLLLLMTSALCISVWSMHAVCASLQAAAAQTSSALSAAAAPVACRRTPLPALSVDAPLPLIVDGVAASAAGGPPPLLDPGCVLRVLVAWVGVGGQRLEDKLQWMRANHAILERTKGPHLHVDYEAYSYLSLGTLDGPTAQPSLRLPPEVRVRYKPGVVWSFVQEELQPSRVRAALYDYLFLLLDDISLHPNFSLAESVRIMQRNQLDVLQPTVPATDSNPSHTYQRPRPEHTIGRLSNRAEFFAYLMPINSYDVYFRRVVTRFPNTKSEAHAHSTPTSLHSTRCVDLLTAAHPPFPSVSQMGLGFGLQPDDGRPPARGIA